VHDEGTKSVPHFNAAAIAAPAGNGANGANGSGNGNGDAPHAVTDGSPGSGAVAVPTAPASPGLQSDPETWAPPPWPPPNPTTGTPEGPAAR
jgi:hypothetical protein